MRCVGDALLQLILNTLLEFLAVSEEFIVSIMIKEVFIFKWGIYCEEIVN